MHFFWNGANWSYSIVWGDLGLIWKISKNFHSGWDYHCTKVLNNTESTNNILNCTGWNDLTTDRQINIGWLTWTSLSLIHWITPCFIALSSWSGFFFKAWKKRSRVSSWPDQPLKTSKTLSLFCNVQPIPAQKRAELWYWRISVMKR